MTIREVARYSVRRRDCWARGGAERWRRTVAEAAESFALVGRCSRRSPCSDTNSPCCNARSPGRA